MPRVKKKKRSVPAVDGCLEVEVPLVTMATCQNLAPGQMLQLDGSVRKGRGVSTMVTVTTICQNDSLRFTMTAGGRRSRLSDLLAGQWSCVLSAVSGDSELTDSKIPLTVTDSDMLVKEEISMVTGDNTSQDLCQEDTKTHASTNHEDLNDTQTDYTRCLPTDIILDHLDSDQQNDDDQDDDQGDDQDDDQDDDHDHLQDIDANLPRSNQKDANMPYPSSKTDANTTQLSDQDASMPMLNDIMSDSSDDLDSFPITLSPTVPGSAIEDSTGEGAGRPRCRFCGKQMNNKDRPEKHESMDCPRNPWSHKNLFPRNAVSKSNPIQCSYCNRGFKCGTSMNTHSKRCARRPAYMERFDTTALALNLCTVCDLMCTTLKGLQMHQVKAHNHVKAARSRKWDRQKAENPKYALCNFCGLVLKSDRNRKSHEQFNCKLNPNLKKRYTCKTCGYFSHREEKLTEHLEKHTTGTEPIHVCEVCGKAFNARRKLSQHRVFHTEVRPRRHKCTQCNLCFVHRGHLKRHLASHGDVRDYMCPICGKGFKTHYHQGEHTRRVHGNQYKFHCEKCGHGVDKMKYLDTHVCGRVRRKQDNQDMSDTECKPGPIDTSCDGMVHDGIEEPEMVHHGTQEAEVMHHGTLEAEMVHHGTQEAEVIHHGTQDVKIVHDGIQEVGMVHDGRQEVKIVHDGTQEVEIMHDGTYKVMTMNAGSTHIHGGSQPMMEQVVTHVIIPDQHQVNWTDCNIEQIERAQETTCDHILS